MARRVFFSFHYDRDCSRTQVVRNSWVTKPDREEAGFFDSSVFEIKKRTSEDALKRFLNDGLSGSSVLCVAVGNQTAWRRWVRYEIVRSFVTGKGIVGVRVHSIKNFNHQVDIAGFNPFSCIGCEIDNGVLKFKERNETLMWVWAKDISSMRVSDVAYDLRGYTNANLDVLFPLYDWHFNDGYNNLGVWVESAAKQAGR